MKKLFLLFSILLCGCEANVSSTVHADQGIVEINGKKCTITYINRGDLNTGIYYVDCGPCSASALSFREGKHDTAVVQSPSASCSCPTAK